MSKLSFRARAVDASKQMPVFLAEELPDLTEYASINRSVPQMPTGMEKDEEMELHLQQAISAQQRSSVGNACEAETVVIPTPKVTADVDYYDHLYPMDYRLPKQLIKVQAALNLEPEIPDYDLDSEDERWLREQKIEISPLQFERIMDTLEKQSEYQVISVTDAKFLVQEDDDVLLGVYDFWLSKRLKAATQGKHLIPRVKTEKREGSGAKNNPYLAFRRRAEKMQTRKNRKNDEESYEKILKLRHDLQKAVTLSEMVKRREKSKRELINLSLDIFEKRVLIGDFTDELLLKARDEAKPSFQFSKHEMAASSNNKRPSKKRKQKDDKGLVSREWLLQNAEDWHKPALFPSTSVAASLHPATSETEALSVAQPEKETEDIDGRYAFKRKRGCHYYAPVSGNENCCWPWEEPRSNSRYFPAYLHSRYSSDAAGLRCIGLARRRLGRGGRYLFDRVATRSPSYDEDTEPNDDSDLPSTSSETVVHRHAAGGWRRQRQITYFRPPSPLLLSELEDDDYYCSAPSPASAFHSVASGSSTPPPPQGVPFATVVGPQGMLRLPLTIGTLTPSVNNDEHANSNNAGSGGNVGATVSRVSSHFQHQHQQHSMGQNRSSTDKRTSASNGYIADGLTGSAASPSPSIGNGDGPSQQHQQQLHKTTTPRERPSKRASNVNAVVSAYLTQHQQTPTESTFNSLPAVKGGENSTSFARTTTTATNQRKRNFGATTALLMRPPVRLSTNAMGGNQHGFQQQHQQQQSSKPMTNAKNSSRHQLPGMTVSSTISTLASQILPGALKGADVNNGKVNLAVVTGGAQPPISAHTYALPPGEYAKQRAQLQSTLQHLQQQQRSNNPSPVGSGAATASPTSTHPQQQSKNEITTSATAGLTVTSVVNGPQRPARSRQYGGRPSHVANGGTPPNPTSNGGSINLTPSVNAQSPATAAAPTANLPVDHGSYHASSFLPPPVATAAISAISSGSLMTNGPASHHDASPEAAVTAQYNGQRNCNDLVGGISSSGFDLGYPLPTPSPSPNARFSISSDGNPLSTKLDDVTVKGTTFSPVVGRFAPRSASKSRKNSEEPPSTVI